MDISPQILNIIGLVFDMIGAWLVASEVTNKFSDKKYEKNVIENPKEEEINEKDGDVVMSDLAGNNSIVTKARTIETKAYKKWQKYTYKYMQIGLGCLTFGFLLQILSNCISL